MNFKKWLLLGILNFFILNAQSQVCNFPVTGNFQLETNEYSGTRDFNKVQVEATTFSLWMDNQQVRSYQIVSPIKGGFAVEQIVVGNAYKETFNVTMQEITASHCAFVIHYEEGSEVINLQRIE